MAKRKPKFKRKQYKLNWAQILSKLQLAHNYVEAGLPKNEVLPHLREALAAIRERCGLPGNW